MIETIISLLLFISFSSYFLLCIKNCLKRQDEIDIENIQDNPEVINENGESTNGWPLGHDRALPAIPATSSISAAIEDFPEDNEGLYDVISKSKQGTGVKAKKLPVENGVDNIAVGHIQIAPRQVIKKKQHPYERVGGEPDTDSATYGASDSRGGVSGDGPSSTDPLYAGIKDPENDSGSGGAIYSAVGGRSVQEIVLGPLLPVLGTGEHAALANHSPLLPPRNGENNSSSRLSHVEINGDIIFPLANQNLSSFDIPDMNFQPIITTKRFPEYSSVSARESLEHLRKREQLQKLRRGMFGGELPEGTYDTINYDFVKPPEFNEATLFSRETSILNDQGAYTSGSELYAEIETEQNSTRSSTYAKVAELPLQDNDERAYQIQSNTDVTDSKFSPKTCQATSRQKSFISNFPNFHTTSSEIYSAVNKQMEDYTPRTQTVYKDTEYSSFDEDDRIGVKRGKHNVHGALKDDSLLRKKQTSTNNKRRSSVNEYDDIQIEINKRLTQTNIDLYDDVNVEPHSNAKEKHLTLASINFYDDINQDKHTEGQLSQTTASFRDHEDQYSIINEKFGNVKNIILSELNEEDIYDTPNNSDELGAVGGVDYSKENFHSNSDASNLLKRKEGLYKSDLNIINNKNKSFKDPKFLSEKSGGSPIYESTELCYSSSEYNKVTDHNNLESENICNINNITNTINIFHNNLISSGSNKASNNGSTGLQSTTNCNNTNNVNVYNTNLRTNFRATNSKITDINTRNSFQLDLKSPNKTNNNDGSSNRANIKKSSYNKTNMNERNRLIYEDNSNILGSTEPRVSITSFKNKNQDHIGNVGMLCNSCKFNDISYSDKSQKNQKIDTADTMETKSNSDISNKVKLYSYSNLNAINSTMCNRDTGNSHCNLDSIKTNVFVKRPFREHIYEVVEDS